MALGLSPMASAEEERDEKFYKKALESWAVQVGEYHQRDAGRVASQHIELLRGLLSEGRALLAQDELDDLEPVVRRIEVRGRYVDALLTRVSREAKAKATEDEALKAEQAASRLTKKAAETKARYNELLKRGL